MRLVLGLDLRTGGDIGVWMPTSPLGNGNAARSRTGRPAAPRDIGARPIARAGGIIQINSLPGDRIDEILVAVGEEVREGQVLARMRSEKLRRAELDAARSRLTETRNSAAAKRTETQANIDTARGRLKQAEAQLKQALEQRKLLKNQSATSPSSQVAALQKQIDQLTALRNDPLTRPMIGATELEARQMELRKLDTSLESSSLAADQAVQAAELAAEMARTR